MIYGLPLGFTSPPEGTHVPHLVHTSGVVDGLVAQRPLVVNQIPPPLTDEEIQNKYEMRNYQKVALMVNHVATLYFEAMQICCALAEKIRVMDGHNSTNLSALEMYLVPDVVIPPKFKVLEFEKYKGLNYPNIHLKVYCKNMGAYAKDDKLMIHCFQDNLTRASAEWYMQLERNNVGTWAELTDAFAKQYEYNTNMALNRTQLQNMS